MCYVYGIVINLQDVVSSGQEFLHRQSDSSELEVCEFSLIMFTLGVQKLPLYHQKLTVGSDQTLFRDIRKSISVNRLNITNLDVIFLIHKDSTFKHI